MNSTYTVDIQLDEKTKKMTASILKASDLTLIEPLVGTFDTEAEVYDAAFEWSMKQRSKLAKIR